MFAMTYLILTIMQYLNDAIWVNLISFSFPGFPEYVIELEKKYRFALSKYNARGDIYAHEKICD